MPGADCSFLQSVVQVLDPQVYLRSVKKHLSEKQGLPAEHQRLTFAVAAAAGKAQDTPALPGSAESLLSGLDSWQVIGQTYHVSNFEAYTSAVLAIFQPQLQGPVLL